MATLTSDQIADLISTTQRDLGKMKWTEIATDLQEHIAMPQILQKEKVQFESGTGIQFNVMVGTSGAARNIGMYANDNVNAGDVMIQGNIGWCHSTTNYTIERREIAMNRDPARIVELVKIRRNDAMIDKAKLMETNFWGKPTGSTDNLTPLGIDAWAVTNATQGFNGGDPAGFSSGIANIPTATYPRWKNYTDIYTAVSKADLVAKWRRAATFTNFKSPLGPNGFQDYNRGNRYGYYTNYAVVGALETLLEDQNDNLGNDLSSKDGQAIFRRLPVTWVPKLEANANNPIYGINWGVFFPVFLKGEYMREEPADKAPNNHSSFVTHVDSTYNFKCTDRRRLFVIATATF